MVSAQ
jgi:hypothetical protein